MRTLLAPLAFLLVFAAPMVQAATYRIAEAKGAIKVWEPVASEWRSLRTGDLIAEGTLVYFEALASVRATGDGSDASLVLAPFEFTAPEPVLTRLEPGSLREYAIGGFFIPIPIPRPKKRDTKPPGIGVAWQRAMQLFSDDKEKPNKDATSTPSADPSRSAPTATAIVEKALPLHVENPRPGENYLVEGFPTQIGVSWKAPDTDLAYEVTIKGVGGQDERRTASTTATSAKFTITGPGRYYVVVRSLDGRYASESTTFAIREIGDF